MIKTVKSEHGLSSALAPSSLFYQRIFRILNWVPGFPSNTPYNLTISKDKKFIYFRVAKVGTRTILYHLKNANVELTAEHPYNCYYPVKKYEDYFKFAFVRNPWDRLVSCWLSKVIKTNYFNFPDDVYQKMQEFDYFVNFVSENIDLERGDAHLRLQSRLIDLNHINYLGRFENFTKDLEEVLDTLGIKAGIMKRGDSKGRKGYQEYYSESSRDKVAELYKRDIQIFKYEF